MDRSIIQSQAQPTVQMRTIFRGSGQKKGLFTTAVETKRVAAYCRVSTVLEQQALSLETQMSVFRQRITEHPGWVLVDVYADEGLSGTGMKKRKEFQRMMADCEAGKIDYIITKSVSRFARNTLECLEAIRFLHAHGTHVLFEKESIDTGGNMSELFLTMMAAFAQEESHSMSGNIKWGIRKRFEAGKGRWCNIYGYRKDQKGKMVIEPAEAEVVRRMYRMYERGASTREIMATLNAENIQTGRENAWSDQAVSDILKNEKYIGDMLLQKTIIVDHLSHRKIKNNQTEYPSYEVSNHHKAIISREQYDRVQKIRSMRDKNGGNIPQYPYGGLGVCCPLCGAPMVMRNTKGFSKRVALGCFTEKGCGRFAMRTYFLDKALVEAYDEVELSVLRKMDEPSESIKQFKALKKEIPQMETVEFYWLDDLVERIEMRKIAPPWKRKSKAEFWNLIVTWKCGLTSTVLMDLERVEHNPSAVAELYWANAEKRGTKDNTEQKNTTELKEETTK